MAIKDNVVVSAVRKGWLSVWGVSKGSVVGKLNIRELFSAILVGAAFYFLGGDLQDALHKLDPNGTVVDNMISAIVAFAVSLLHQSANGAKKPDGTTNPPVE